MNRMIIFDDGRGQFGPMTDLRASFEMRTGMLTTAGRIATHRPRTLAGYWVPEHLRDIVGERANAPVNDLPDDEVFYCVNGRWAMPDESRRLETNQAIIEQETEHVVAAMLRRADAEYFFSSGELPERVERRAISDRLLYRWPWDVLANAWRTIPHDILNTRVLDARLPDAGVTMIAEHPIEVHETARIHSHVVLDASQGPILIQERVTVRPMSVICGPCSIGYDSLIIDRSLIKPNTVVGPNCKVGGEVGATIFQGYSNKAHDGHLGDAWVGKWVNIGAGTDNSNLLNTYGEVPMRIEPDGPRRRSGLTFLGSILGDHVKLAIGTRLMTGTVIGTGAMIASSTPPPTTTRRFAWVTDDGERVFQWKKFAETAHAMMARRKKTPTEAYLRLMQQLHEQATGTRCE